MAGGDNRDQTELTESEQEGWSASIPLASMLMIHLLQQWYEVGGFYWTALVPDVVNSGREEQGLVSL